MTALEYTEKNSFKGYSFSVWFKEHKDELILYTSLGAGVSTALYATVTMLVSPDVFTPLEVAGAFLGSFTGGFGLFFKGLSLFDFFKKE